MEVILKHLRTTIKQTRILVNLTQDGLAEQIGALTDEVLHIPNIEPNIRHSVDYKV